MSKCLVSEEQLLDYYHGETKNLKLKEHLEHCSRCQEYLNSLTVLEEELNLFDYAVESHLVNQFEPNLEFVFQEAEVIEKKRLLKETFFFGGVSLGLLLVFFGLILSWEVKFLVYFQIVAYVLMPLILLPLLKLKEEKGVN